jgi:hypothetical protein
VGFLTLVLALPVFAGVTPAEVCSTSSPDAKAFVDARLTFWQERLQLADWNVSVTMTRKSELKAKTLGGIRWDKSKKTASMAVMHVADYSMSCAEMLADMEFTIVHELVHLELASLPKSEASRSSEEFAVNRIADALLKLQRQD